MSIDWAGLPSFDEGNARNHLAAYSDRFAQIDPVFGAAVDVEVLVYRGIRFLPAASYPELVVPDLEGSVVVKGDLIVDDVLQQPFQASALLIDGDLKAKHLVTTGCLVVTGNVELDGVFYGNCTNYCTHVYGDFKAQEIVLEKNHHFAVHGQASAELRLEDEDDGYEATEAWMQKRGVRAHDETALAQVLRAVKS